ncbi:hypothetical protein PVAR5_2771 [Paecilomyces variotii No. 5]|uniref:Uncharacterized protein n=1 Tax=Byssochlamys spectabilis (strain No. 5 / NBRC 109023) TaxID=1356009 RepID=V5HWH0_BYSSN|nr:hypothetical protein PVAR5_2771 [Paecilomyces variotii No. 5]
MKSSTKEIEDADICAEHRTAFAVYIQDHAGPGESHAATSEGVLRLQISGYMDSCRSDFWGVQNLSISLQVLHLGVFELPREAQRNVEGFGIVLGQGVVVTPGSIALRYFQPPTDSEESGIDDELIGDDEDSGPMSPYNQGGEPIDLRAYWFDNESEWNSNSDDDQVRSQGPRKCSRYIADAAEETGNDTDNDNEEK